MSPDYLVQPFSIDSYPLMNVLFMSAYNSSISRESFIKKYDTSAFGQNVIGFIAVHKPTQIPAAYYGVFPVKILLHGKELMAAQSGDTMTHKDHRKKGLFVELAKMTFNTCAEKGIHIIFGMPNENSYPGFIRRLNWQHIDDIVRFDLKLFLKTLPLPKLFRKAGSFSVFLIYARFILRNFLISPPVDFTSHSLFEEGKILRDQNYLSYKKDNDKFFLQIGKCIFWIKLTDIFWIGDVADYEKVNQKTIRKLKRLAFFLGYNTIVFHLNKSSPIPDFLKQFKPYNTEPSCIFYTNQQYKEVNLFLTGADFDTW